MATSSFKKNFSVDKKNIDKFVKKMIEEVEPTLNKGFNSKFTTIKKLKEEKGNR